LASQRATVLWTTLIRLDRHRAELLAMHLGGASTAELQRWLRKNRIKVVHSTVARWLAKHTAPIH
jgi:predicted site-specific integrase-resolvase